jgi:hypothetical protein
VTCADSCDDDAIVNDLGECTSLSCDEIGKDDTKFRVCGQKCVYNEGENCSDTCRPFQSANDRGICELIQNCELRVPEISEGFFMVLIYRFFWFSVSLWFRLLLTR